MRTTFLASAILVGILALGGTMARAQEQATPAPRVQWTATDMAAIYSTEQSQVTPTGGGNFWFQGASLNGAFTFYRGLGFAADLTGEHASHIAPGVGLNEIDFMVGPRYTFHFSPKSKHENRFFVEALVGGARGLSSDFPKATGLDTKASSFSYQVGGGWDIQVTKHIAIRAVEADYIESLLPNNGSDTQHRIRLGFGVTYHSHR